MKHPNMTLSIRCSVKHHIFAPGDPVPLHVSMKNVGVDSLYVVTSEPMVWMDHPNKACLFIGEGDVPPGMTYYAYTPPPLERLDPAKTMALDFDIRIPPPEGTLDEEGVYHEVHTPMAGHIKLNVRVGYLTAPFVPPLIGAWEAFVQQQQRSNSSTLTIEFLEPAVR